MPVPQVPGYKGSENQATFLRILDGHISTNRYSTTTSGDEGEDYPQVADFQNAHEIGNEDYI